MVPAGERFVETEVGVYLLDVALFVDADVDDWWVHWFSSIGRVRLKRKTPAGFDGNPSPTGNPQSNLEVLTGEIAFSSDPRPADRWSVAGECGDRVESRLRHGEMTAAECEVVFF